MAYGVDSHMEPLDDSIDYDDDSIYNYNFVDDDDDQEEEE